MGLRIGAEREGGVYTRDGTEGLPSSSVGLPRGIGNGACVPAVFPIPTSLSGEGGCGCCALQQRCKMIHVAPVNQ